MSSEKADIAGGCLCGAIRFRATQFDTPSLCHCGQCRRWAGHAWAAVGGTDLKIRGRKHLRWYHSSEDAQRGFCGTCGSSLFWKRDGALHISISMGCIDAPTGMQLGGHIFTAHKGDYYDIADDLPQEEN
ncbi:GFA family protein [Paracoccus sediminicola]|uniref:GFA family protein n=1 Tax=Paracoccus sediminicola TaxID=3017783 RepID=UPI0022F038C4|nr:GFA family protein [Paracoccus sediminicola]WBU56389.1 GFA family protein [Paracoccus sediminicola]